MTHTKIVFPDNEKKVQRREEKLSWRTSKLFNARSIQYLEKSKFNFIINDAKVALFHAVIQHKFQF